MGRIRIPDTYSTHAGVLASFVQEWKNRNGHWATPSCMEFGAGLYSTPLLAALLGPLLHTYDTNRAWVKRINAETMANVEYVANYSHLIADLREREPRNRPDFAFVDSAGPPTRSAIVGELIRHELVDYILVHDAGWIRKQSNWFSDPKELSKWPMQVYAPVRPATILWCRPSKPLRLPIPPVDWSIEEAGNDS